MAFKIFYDYDLKSFMVIDFFSLLQINKRASSKFSRKMN